MRKIGISLSINLSKIDKSKIFEGKKGQYLDLTTFVNLDDVDEYGKNGFITQSISKENRSNGVKMPIIGNNKVFWTNDEASTPSAGSKPDRSDDIPF